MNKTALAEAVRHLTALRRFGPGRPAALAELPEHCRPATLDDAARVQAALRESLAATEIGAPVGWKIGCTTEVMQQYLGIAHPCAGTLYAGRLWRGEAELHAADYHRLGLECELAVRLGADLPSRPEGFDRQSVARAVQAWMASVEVVEHRFEPFEQAGTATLIADDFFSAGCVLGDPVAAAEMPDAGALHGGFVVNGEPAAPPGAGAAILGHPLNALAWLATEAARTGKPLVAGDIVTLGSVVKTIYPRAGDVVVARFDGLAPVRIRVL